MKSSFAILSAVIVLAAAIILSGFELNAPAVLAICITAGISGIAVADYSRRPATSKLDAVKVPARRAAASRTTEATPVFASLIVFNTTIA